MADKGQENKRGMNKSRSKSRREFVSRNPFVNFVRSFRQLPENQNTPQSLIFKLAGERWRSMSDNERAPFINAAKEMQDKEPRIKKPKGKKKGENTTKVTTEKNKKKIKKRKCSNCGHRHGCPGRHGGSSDSLDQDPMDDDDDDDDDKTSVQTGSKSRSRSPSKSGSGSNDETNYWSDSDTTF